MKFIIDIPEKDVQGCYNCPFNYDFIACVAPNGPDYVDIDDYLGNSFITTRPEGCPLIPVVSDQEEMDKNWPECGGALHKAALDSSNCTNSERTNDACKPTTYDNGYPMDRVEPGEYYEFWEPACACGSCGELIPMRKFCSNCGRRLEVDDG